MGWKLILFTGAVNVLPENPLKNSRIRTCGRLNGSWTWSFFGSAWCLVERLGIDHAVGKSRNKISVRIKELILVAKEIPKVGSFGCSSGPKEWSRMA